MKTYSKSIKLISNLTFSKSGIHFKNFLPGLLTSQILKTMVSVESKHQQSFINVNKDNPFPIQNLPFGVFKKLNETYDQRRIGVAIGDFVFDVNYLTNSEQFKPFSKEIIYALRQNKLNDFFSLTPQDRKQVRKLLQAVLDKDSTIFSQDSINLEKALIKMDDVDMCMPLEIGDYTDFYASRNHAENVGEMFRGKDNKLMPNWLHMPIGYHGRASSININQDVVRPAGQVNNGEFKLESKLDYELEIAMIVGGKTNKQFDVISVNQASENIAGYVLMNDHSARMIQKTEYQPLGPFLGKNFSTTISPWVVMPEALEPFKENISSQPNLLPYLSAKQNYVYNLPLQVYLQPKGCSEKFLITDSNMKYLYWTFEQMIAHHTSSGCNLRPGDMFGSGTISGPQHNKNGGCLLELTWNGQRPLTINNQKYTFLQDGDILTMTGGNYLSNNGPFIGFGNIVNKYISNKLQI